MRVWEAQHPSFDDSTSFRSGECNPKDSPATTSCGSRQAKRFGETRSCGDKAGLLGCGLGLNVLSVFAYHIQGLGFRVEGLGFTVYGLGFFINCQLDHLVAIVPRTREQRIRHPKNDPHKPQKNLLSSCVNGRAKVGFP